METLVSTPYLIVFKEANGRILGKIHLSIRHPSLKNLQKKNQIHFIASF